VPARFDVHALVTPQQLGVGPTCPRKTYVPFGHVVGETFAHTCAKSPLHEWKLAVITQIRV